MKRPIFCASVIRPACHARWLTLALRIMSVYIRGGAAVGESHGLEVCNNKLKTLVDFICQVYGPTWFLVKKDKLFQHQALYLYKQIEALRSQPEDIRAVAFRNIDGCLFCQKTCYIFW